MILIALGANLPSRYGVPENTIEAAYQALEKLGVSVLKRSRIWITEPVPVSDQPWYRNAVASVATEADPQELFKILKDIERDFGRDNAERNAARLLDLDLIAYGDEVFVGEDLTIPHARMHQRAFVLSPLCDVAPDWRHPVFQRTAQKLLQDLPEGAVAKPLYPKAA